jgi:HEAT repeats
MLLDYQTDEVGRLAKDDSKFRAALIQAFSDSSEIVRERALLDAIELGDPTIVTDAAKTLTDEDADVRVAAAQLLAWYGQPRTIPDLIGGLKDSNTWVRSHCAAGLSKLLPGPTWARLPAEDIDQLISGLPGMSEDDVSRFLTSLGISTEAADRFVTWREAKFDVEIDMKIMLEELEGRPIILTEETRSTKGKAAEKAGLARGVSLSPEVEAILAELPEGIRVTLPPEDLRRLNPATARELVNSLMASFPTAAEAKKSIKVRKVKKVRKVSVGPTREELISSLPSEVKDEVSPEIMDTLTKDELEALVGKSAEEREIEAETGEEAPLSEVAEEPELGVTKVAPAPSMKQVDPRWQELATAYGEAKADLLIQVPARMLEGLPPEQIQEMDTETLKNLTDALKPRE